MINLNLKLLWPDLDSCDTKIIKKRHYVQLINYRLIMSFVNFLLVFDTFQVNFFFKF